MGQTIKPSLRTSFHQGVLWATMIYHITLACLLLILVIVPYYSYGLNAINFRGDPDKLIVPTPFSFFPYSDPLFGRALHHLISTVLGLVMFLTPVTAILGVACWWELRTTQPQGVRVLLLAGVGFCVGYFLYMWLAPFGNMNFWILVT